MPRRTLARIYPQRLQHNLRRVRELAPHSKVMACVKADGYGHGLRDVASAFAGHCDGLAVATLEEALALRGLGATGDILLLEGVHEQDDWHAAVSHRLTVAVSDLEQLRWLEAERPSPAPRCWIKIDTGMHRLGLAPGQVSDALQRLRSATAADATPVLMTHFARADEPENAATDAQLRCFEDNTAELALPRSAANSAAVLSRPDAHFDWVRPGYMLYGGSPFAARSAADCGLLPAMEFSSVVISLRNVDSGEPVGYGGRWTARRPSRIATVAAGYGDGYPRHARDGTPVLINGQRAALAGRVSMDMLTVDVTDLDRIAVGDAVLLWGTGLPVDEIARCAETIGYELLAGMPQRTLRECRDEP